MFDRVILYFEEKMLEPICYMIIGAGLMGILVQILLG